MIRRLLPVFSSFLALWLSAPVLWASEPSAALHELFAEEWETRLREDPLTATSAGRHEYDHLLPSRTLKDLQRRHHSDRRFLERLHTIDRAALNDSDRISYDIFARQLTVRMEEFEIGHYRLPLTVDSGFHIGFARLPSEMPFTSPEGYRNYIARLRAFPEYVRQHVVLMREGLSHGMTLPKVVLEGYEITIESHVVDEVEQSLFYGPFERFPQQIAEAVRLELVAEGKEAIREGVVAGYRAFLEFMTEEYIPGARESLGASDLENGDAYYAQRIRNFTTLDLSADEIHRIGLEEVRRIRSEMEAVIEAVEFEGSFPEFLEFLRTDPRFYPKTAEELLKQLAIVDAARG